MRDRVIGMLCVGGASRRLSNKQAGCVLEFSQAASSYVFCCYCVYLFILSVNCAALNTLVDVYFKCDRLRFICSFFVDVS